MTPPTHGRSAAQSTGIGSRSLSSTPAPARATGVWGHGQIAADGSVSGIARDSNRLTLPFTMPAGTAFQVLSYGTPVTWAVISGHNARFGFTIPKGTPAGLSGLHIVVKVRDGGTPGWKYAPTPTVSLRAGITGQSPSTRSPAATSSSISERRRPPCGPFLAEGPHVRLDTPNRFTGAPPAVLLMQPGQFSCPRCGPTNAVAQPITAGALTNPLAGFCHRCEHSYQFTVGSPSTTTTGTADVEERRRWPPG